MFLATFPCTFQFKPLIYSSITNYNRDLKRKYAKRAVRRKPSEKANLSPAVVGRSGYCRFDALLSLGAETRSYLLNP